MIGEININSHMWRRIENHFSGSKSAATLVVRSSDYCTHGSTVGMWPTKNHMAIRCWHLAQGSGCAGQAVLAVVVGRCKCAFQPHGGLKIYKCNTLSLTEILTKRRDPLF